MKAIHVENLHFRWPRSSQDCLVIPDFSIGKGERVFLQGASGSGKSTLLNLLTGVMVPSKGSVTILDNDIAAWSVARRDRFRVAHIGFIFQQFNLLTYLSALENVVLPCWFSPHRRNRASAAKDLRNHARELMYTLGLDEDSIARPVTQLSVGQQQRVAVARALIGAPELIIADEPTSALDADNRDAFIRLLFEQAQDSTVLFVSHDHALASRFDRNISMATLNQARVS